jgi:integrase
MTSSTHTISSLRQRMLDDMRMRKLSQTQASYIRIVKRFAAFLGRSPDTASTEVLCRYQWHLVDHGISSISLNATFSGLKFLFETTLDLPELMAKMHAVHEPRKLPVVLNREEVARLLANAGRRDHLARVRELLQVAPDHVELKSTEADAPEKNSTADLRLPGLWCGDDHCRNPGAQIALRAPPPHGGAP